MVYRLLANFCRLQKVLETKVLPWVERSLRNQTERSGGTHLKDVQDWLHARLSFGPLTFTRFEPSRLQLVDAHCGKDKTPHSNTYEFKASVNHSWRSMRKGFVRNDVCKSFRPQLEHVVAAKDGRIENFNVFGC